MAAVTLGIARGMVTDFTALATKKTPGGGRQRMCENQVIQSQLAQVEARLGSARAFLLSGLAEIWEAVGETGELSLEQNTMIRLASTWAIHQARATTARSSAVSATCIPPRNRPRGGRRITRRSAESCSASNRIPRCSPFSSATKSCRSHGFDTL